jgi:hypothetical protein
MYLIVGEPNATVLGPLESVCERRNKQMVLVKELPQSFTWCFNCARSCSEVSIGNRKVHVEEVEGVLVQNPPRLDPATSPEAEAEYVQAESNAILFAWFSTFTCRVVNRYPAMYWFAPSLCLPLWETVIHESGLKIAPAIVSNVESELKTFAAMHGGEVSYEPFCGSDTYTVSTREDWAGLSTMAAICPVNLAKSFPLGRVACVVGNRVFWSRPLNEGMADNEASVMRIARAIELDFLEIHFVGDKGSLYVQRLEPFPKLDAFDDDSRRLIAEALVDFLDPDAPLMK